LIEFLQHLGYSAPAWTAILACTLIIGIGRAGIFGVMVLVVPVLSLFLGGKAAAGMILPLMVLGDWIALFIYRRSIPWKQVLTILPWLIVGILLGAWVGERVSDRVFKNIMGVITFLCLGFLLWREARGEPAVNYPLPVLAGIGILAGFASMIGNASGPIISVYFFTCRFDKIRYVSAMVSLFWIVNMIKIPFHVFYWGTITPDSFRTDLILAPLLLAGAFLGFRIIRKIPERPFKIFILASIAVSGVALMF